MGRRTRSSVKLKEVEERRIEGDPFFEGVFSTIMMKILNRYLSYFSHGFPVVWIRANDPLLVKYLVSTSKAVLENIDALSVLKSYEGLAKYFRPNSVVIVVYGHKVWPREEGFPFASEESEMKEESKLLCYFGDFFTEDTLPQSELKILQNAAWGNKCLIISRFKPENPDLRMASYTEGEVLTAEERFLILSSFLEQETAKKLAAKTDGFNLSMLLMFRKMDEKRIREWMAKTVDVEITETRDIRLRDLVLSATEAEYLKNLIIRPFLRRKRIRKVGGRTHNNIFVLVPEGMTAADLAQALANDLKLPYTEVEFQQFASRYYGEAERKLANILRRLENIAPLVVHLDLRTMGFKKSFGASGQEEAHEVTQRIKTIITKWLREDKDVIVVASVDEPIEKITGLKLMSFYLDDKMAVEYIHRKLSRYPKEYVEDILKELPNVGRKLYLYTREELDQIIDLALALDGKDRLKRAVDLLNFDRLARRGSLFDLQQKLKNFQFPYKLYREYNARFIRLHRKIEEWEEEMRQLLAASEQAAYGEVE